MNSFLRSLLLFGLFAAPLAAAVRLPAIVGSHMVLQQKSTVTLWGWANPAEAVTVSTSWSTNTAQATASNGGRWSVAIQTPGAGGPHSVRIRAANEIVLDDVLIGEAWLCSGQSNMEWSGDLGVRQSQEEAPGATNNLIRFFHVPKATADAPQDHVDAQWVVCNPADMRRFSAIGYFFGKRIHERMSVPVGLINSSWGGTPAEVWTPREVVEAAPDLRSAATEIKPAAWWPHQPGLAYNAMIHPVLPFRIAGVLWYQGESNVVTHSTYRKLFTYLIDSWRAAWKSDLPFYFVQIAPFTYGDDHIRGALLREAQTQAAEHPRTGMVVISDLVDNVKDIHPQMKREVAERLASLALADTYHVATPAPRSPNYRSHRIEADAVRLELDPVPTTLVSRGGPPTGFQIAGADGKFVPAEATIDGKSLRVSSTNVPNPVAVRFGFRNDSIPNLFTAEGLPVNLFRTDRP